MYTCVCIPLHSQLTNTGSGSCSLWESDTEFGLTTGWWELTRGWESKTDCDSNPESNTGGAVCRRLLLKTGLG